MNFNFKKLLLSTGIALLAGTVTQAQAMPMVSVYGLGNYTFYNIDAPGGTIRGTFGYGGGLMTNFMLSSGIGFELAAGYEAIRIKATVTGLGSSTGTGKAISIPAGLTFHLAGMSHLFLGGYFDYALKDNADNDYGAAVGIRFRTGPVFFEPRFKYGFKKDSSDKNLMVGQLLLGYTFGGKM